VHYCSPDCLERAVEGDSRQLFFSRATGADQRHRIPLGLLLLSRGELDQQQLRAGLEAHRLHGGRLGDWLQSLGFVSERQVAAALGMQWACPVLLSPLSVPPQCAAMLPFTLLEHQRMLPVSAVAQRSLLHLGFCDGVDYIALHSVRQMLGCQVEACILPTSALFSGLDQIRPIAHASELIFESCSDANGVARIAAGYAFRLRSGEVRMAACGDYLWFRLWHREPMDLLVLKPGRPDGPTAPCA
jgi:hypothetical protein